MSEEQVEGFGIYHPEAAQYAPFNDAMAAWRNQVRSMQAEGTLPAPEEPSEAVKTSSDPEPQESAEAAVEEVSASETADEAEDVEAEVPAEVYDPAEHTSPDVLYYLKICGYDEAVRIFDSEEHGKNRKGILNLKQEILDQAWKTSHKDSDSAP